MMSLLQAQKKKSKARVEEDEDGKEEGEVN
jgi:hypothetical protein